MVLRVAHVPWIPWISGWKLFLIDVKKEQPFSEGTSIEVILFLSQSIRVQCI